MADCLAVRRGKKRAVALADALAALHGTRAAARADVSVALVHAEQPSVLGLLPLSLVDTQLVFDAAPLSWTWFYETALDGAAMRSALARVLVAYPLFAGRLVRLPRDAHGRHRVAVACNNQGALLSRVHVPGVPLPRGRGVPSGELPPWVAAWEGPPSLKALADDAHAPLLEVVLVTHERGCSLCVKSSHGLTDGHSLAMFVAAWARCLAAPDAPLPRPLLDRRAQDELAAGWGSAAAADNDAAAAGTAHGCACAPPVRPAASPSGAITDVLSTGALVRLGARAVVDPSMGFHTHGRAVVGACFHFSAAQLARIKRAASAADAADGSAAAALVPAETTAEAVEAASSATAVAADAMSPSTFDALLALLWRALFRAKKRRGLLDNSHLAPPRLFFPANVRARVQPPLPASFVGNATMGIVVQADADTLQGGGLHELATMVQRSKQAAVAAPSICQQLAFLDAETKRGRAKRWAVNPFDNVMLFSDWRFPDAPLYAAATFGDVVPFWFEPALDVAVRIPYVGCVCQAPPGCPEQAGGVTVLVNLPADELPAVLKTLSDEAWC